MKIQAKITQALKIEETIANDFLIDNHSQKTINSAIKIVSVALQYENELIAIAQFCAPRTSRKKKKYSTELLRLAFKKDVRVVGGASKLIKYYISEYNPADIFTYQDATGENTKVYEHAGFTFVSQEKKKEYLVAPGHTLESGNRKEVIGMPYATQYGPDRILGTKLGEVIDPETGKRKSNKRIFIEDLGWHVEATPGDKVYEWFNPNMTHYVYKITATDSDKYYYGVSHVKKANATEQDCLNDGYYGSGGKNSDNKFKNWKKKHQAFLEKEIVQTFSEKMKAYQKEENLIGDNYKTDALCLNSTKGGIFGGLIGNAIRISLKECPIHGETKHRGDSCSSCNSQSSVIEKVCEVHGLSKHKGEKCYLCISSESMSDKNCSVHGITSHMGDTCKKCVSVESFSEKLCKVHGMSQHKGIKCAKCYIGDSILQKICKVHGSVDHIGDRCFYCHSQNSITEQDCVVHGLSKHRGSKCVKCFLISSNKIGVCEIHGETPFGGNTCKKCSSQNSVKLGICRVHGETSFQGKSCKKCASQKSIVKKNCDIHGFVAHSGNSCKSCASMKTAHKRFHMNKPNDKCYLCN